MTDHSHWPEHFDITLVNPSAAQYVKAVRDCAKVIPNGLSGDKRVRVNVRVIGGCADCYDLQQMLEDM
jgi:hypothetical protein